METTGIGTIPPSAPRAPLAPVTHDGLAVASLVLSLLWLGGLGALLAVIFGHVSHATAKREHRQPSGMATAGLVLGYIGLAAAVIIWIVVAVAAAKAAQQVPAPCDITNPAFPYC